MAWWNKLWEKIKEWGRSAKEWSGKQWIKLKNWWKKYWKIVAIIVAVITVVIIIAVAIYFLLPYTISATVKTAPVLVTKGGEKIKNLPARIKESFNPPAIITNHNDFTIETFEPSYFLQALASRGRTGEPIIVASNTNIPYENTTSTTTSENNKSLIASIFNKEDFPHHNRQAYNCDFIINNERFTRLEISQYYKTKPGREMINDDLIRKIVESLNGKEWVPDTKKEPNDWDYFTKNICHKNSHYRLICGRENNSTTWGVLNIHPIKVKNNK